jgi:RNA polymerase sigma-70 factor (ECF subfamily)
MANTEFEALVEAHYEKLYRFAYSLGGDPDLASDLTQQTFYVYARKRSQIRDPRRTKAWLFTILHREFIALKRKSSRHPQFELEMMEHELPTIEPEGVAKLDAQILMATLQRLDERFREVLVLYHIDDLAYREIAEILKLPIGTVMSRLARGREHLLNLLNKAEETANNIVALSARNSA